jgi:MOSC domain-containing protein YiiM
MSLVDHVFVGALAPLPPEGQMSGIVKAPLGEPVTVGSEGLGGDRHGDPRYHGGPEKAVHHYPAEHYRRLTAQFPAVAARLVAGALGENLSTIGWTEEMVCVGDVFAAGSCRLQVSQPRTPCWKINHRIGEMALSAFVAEHGIVGWYYRVLEGGTLAAGDRFELLERPSPGVTLRRLWEAGAAHRPDPDELDALSRARGLSAAWSRKLGERAEWLRRNAGAA